MTIVFNSGDVNSQIWPNGEIPMSFNSLEACQNFIPSTPAGSPEGEIKFQRGSVVGLHQSNNAATYFQCTRLAADMLL